MHPEFIRALRGRMVELEYQPPQRSAPEHIMPTQTPIIWDLFCDDRITLVITNVQSTQEPPPSEGAQPGTSPTQSNLPPPKSQPIRTYLMNWMETEHIIEIRERAGLYILTAKNKPVAEPRATLYPELAVKEYWPQWNRVIWEHIEDSLIEMGMREARVPLPGYPETETEPVQEQPEQPVPGPLPSQEVTATAPIEQPVQEAAPVVGPQPSGPVGTAPTQPNVTTPDPQAAVVPSPEPAVNVNPLQS